MKYNLLLYLIFINTLISQDSTEVIENSSENSSVQGAFGAVTIDGKIWNQIALRPTLPFGPLTIALDLVIYVDQNGKTVYLKENRELQDIKIEDVSKLLLIKKDILDKFEKGEVNIQQASYLKGFLNSYIKFLKLDDLCILNFTETKKVSKLKKSTLQLESSELKKK